MRRLDAIPPVKRRPGNVLLEFAVVALVLYLLLAGTFEFGRAIYCAQVLQHSADLCAREISRTPLPATDSFLDALQDPLVIKNVFDPSGLVVDIDGKDANGIDDAFRALPIVNQQLRTVMIQSYIGGKQYLRFPGAIVTGTPGKYPFMNSPYSVLIPLVKYDTATGAETFDKWVPVVEGITANNDPNPFSITGINRGIVALRINYPYQAATLTNYIPRDPNVAGSVTIPITPGNADAAPANYPTSDPKGVDVTLVEVDPEAPGGKLINGSAVTSGKAGLGKQYALGQEVRPYRKVISTQAIYRREVFN